MYANEEPNESDLELELVQVLFRHGVRNLVQEELKTCQFNDTPAYAKCDLGQLTNVGKRQMYELGLFLKERYKNFLTKHYVSEEIYAFSSNMDRTKMSLELVLAGLYPPMDHEVWNPNLAWSPIPYIYVPREFDILLLYAHTLLSFPKLTAEVYQTAEFREKIAEYADFLKFLTAETNVKFNENLTNIIILDSSFHEHMNLPLPHWYGTEMKEKLKALTGIVYDGCASTLETKKLGVGFLIKTFVENMNLKRANVNPRKIYLYSGHDFNIALFTRAHDIEEFKYLDFGCSVIFEELRDSNNHVYVRLLFRTNSGTLVTLKLGNYKEFCPIEEYLKIVELVIPSEIEIDGMLKDASIPNLRNIFFSDPVVKQSQGK